MSIGTEEKNYNNEEKETVAYPFSVVVRFRGEGKPYSFGSFHDDYLKDDWVVVETQQGLEMGQVQAEPLSVEKFGLHMPTKPVIRKASERDHRDFEDNLNDEEDAFNVCCDYIEELKLEMHLLSAQYTLDRSKILFVYIADQRVDFRELLKKLGMKLHCRIELKQIGERDKAKMVGGIGMCGMECCCSRFKSHFDVISINMAKNQLLALNIDKLSGMCGKLKCCLKYEDDDYKALTEGLPKTGSQVEYEGEIYRVTSMNIMSEEAKLENHQEVIFVTLKDLKDKGIPRKGAVMKKNEEGTKKVIHKIVHENRPEGQPKHVSYDLKAPETKKEETRTFSRSNNNNNNHRPRPNNSNQNNNNHRRNNNDSHKGLVPQTENKNVTVRTFGKKKKDTE